MLCATEAENGSAEEMVKELSSLLKMKPRVYLEEFLDGWDLYHLALAFYLDLKRHLASSSSSPSYTYYSSESEGAAPRKAAAEATKRKTAAEMNEMNSSSDHSEREDRKPPSLREDKRKEEADHKRDQKKREEKKRAAAAAASSAAPKTPETKAMPKKAKAAKAMSDPPGIWHWEQRDQDRGRVLHIVLVHTVNLRNPSGPLSRAGFVPAMHSSLLQNKLRKAKFMIRPQLHVGVLTNRPSLAPDPFEAHDINALPLSVLLPRPARWCVHLRPPWNPKGEEVLLYDHLM
ncbi:hypothetical protein AK812_SmicGene482 [Symbiodinium microadriaticum]|uniref:Uncharacterized protein n=1 Tax=Symbiodinium microadriaticum TaxID=2951 RepID=A0A1Q9F6E1_SYMMI|nr:hypothetical protein AK812_SmicGene482 [Symbiodinium microadriaticum]